MWGIIKTLTDRGFGFVSVEGLGKDVFFHSEALEGILFEELRVGDVINFEIAQGEKGPAAVHVQRNGGSQRANDSELVLVDAGLASASSEAVAIETAKTLTDEVIRRLNRNPDELYRLHPSMFEELIAEIFVSEGFTTEFVKGWNQADGGIDILAVRRDVGGFPMRYAIQCKRSAAHRLLTAAPIRSLAGVLDRFQAHVGVVATTSYFTKPARAETEAHFWKIALRDYESIVKSLRRLELLKVQPGLQDLPGHERPDA